MKDIFSYNADINKTAYVNWRIERNDSINNLIVIANGYMESAITLAKSLIQDNSYKRADILIFPILFNANHAIELYLKSIEWSLNKLLDNGQKIEKIHNIKQIFSTVKKRVYQFEKDKEDRNTFNEMTEGVESYIEELDSIINKENNKNNNMDFSRYPFDNNYRNHFYVDEFRNVVVDIENFTTRFKEIGKNLDCISKHYLYDFEEM